MKTKKMLAIGTFALALTATSAFGQMQLDSVKVTTNAEAEKVVVDGGKAYLSSVDIYGGSTIEGGSLIVDSKAKAGTVTVKEGGEVGIASLLLHGSKVGAINGELKMDATVGDVTVLENARVDISTVHMNDSTISGNLEVNGTMKTTAGNITAKEGVRIGLASILMDGSEVNNVTINNIEAKVGDLIVGENGHAYLATLNMNNATAGDITIEKAYANVGTLTVGDNGRAYLGALSLENSTAKNITFSGLADLGGTDVEVGDNMTLSVASAVLENANIGGDINLDLSATASSGIEMTDGSTILMGGVNIQ